MSNKNTENEARIGGSGLNAGLGIVKLTPSRHAALTKLIKNGEIQWSGTTTQEANAFNWLVKNGYAKSFNGRYTLVPNVKIRG